MRHHTHSPSTPSISVAGSFSPFKTRLLRQLTTVAVVLAFAGAAIAAPKNWTGPGGTATAPVGGVWDTNTLNWTLGAGAGDVTFTNNQDGAVFGGPDGTYVIQCTNLNWTNIVFNASGYILSNDTPV